MNHTTTSQNSKSTSHSRPLEGLLVHGKSVFVAVAIVQHAAILNLLVNLGRTSNSTLTQPRYGGLKHVKRWEGGER